MNYMNLPSDSSVSNNSENFYMGMIKRCKNQKAHLFCGHFWIGAK